jgi:hypothetical protein
VVGRRGENFGAEKRWKKKSMRVGGWDFGSSTKRLQQAHPELVHWWLLVHSRLPFTYGLLRAIWAWWIVISMKYHQL